MAFMENTHKKNISENSGWILCPQYGRKDQSFPSQLLLHVKFSSGMKTTKSDPLAPPHHRKFILALVPQLARPSGVLLKLYVGSASVCEH